MRRLFTRLIAPFRRAFIIDLKLVGSHFWWFPRARAAFCSNRRLAATRDLTRRRTIHIYVLASARVVCALVLRWLLPCGSRCMASDIDMAAASVVVVVGGDGRKIEVCETRDNRWWKWRWRRCVQKLWTHHAYTHTYTECHYRYARRIAAVLAHRSISHTLLCVISVRRARALAFSSARHSVHVRCATTFKLALSARARITQSNGTAVNQPSMYSTIRAHTHTHTLVNIPPVHTEHQ